MGSMDTAAFIATGGGVGTAERTRPERPPPIELPVAAGARRVKGPDPSTAGVNAEYQPGVCNIGRAERRVRYGLGAASFVLAAGLVLAVPLVRLPRWTLLLTALPLFGGFIGYYQGREGFCVRFALAGVHNMSDRLSEHDRVSDADANRRDRRRARSLTVRAGAAAAVVAVGLYLAVPA